MKNREVLETKQKLTTRLYVEAHVCCTCLDVITVWAAYIARTYVTNPLLSPTIHTVRTSTAVFIREKTITGTKQLMMCIELCLCIMPTKFTKEKKTENSSL